MKRVLDCTQSVIPQSQYPEYLHRRWLPATYRWIIYTIIHWSIFRSKNRKQPHYCFCVTTKLLHCDPRIDPRIDWYTNVTLIHIDQVLTIVGSDIKLTFITNIFVVRSESIGVLGSPFLFSHPINICWWSVVHISTIYMWHQGVDAVFWCYTWWV